MYILTGNAHSLYRVVLLFLINEGLKNVNKPLEVISWNRSAAPLNLNVVVGPLHLKRLSCLHCTNNLA